MKNEELEVLLGESLGANLPAPPYLNTRLAGTLALARKAPRSISLWWLPLAMTLALALPAFLLGMLVPWPGNVVLKLGAVLTVAAAAAFTAVGLLCFDLREKGRVVLWQS